MRLRRGWSHRKRTPTYMQTQARRVKETRTFGWLSSQRIPCRSIFRRNADTPKSYRRPAARRSGRARTSRRTRCRLLRMRPCAGSLAKAGRRCAAVEGSRPSGRSVVRTQPTAIRMNSPGRKDDVSETWQLFSNARNSSSKPAKMHQQHMTDQRENQISVFTRRWDTTIPAHVIC